MALSSSRGDQMVAAEPIEGTFLYRLLLLLNLFYYRKRNEIGNLLLNYSFHLNFLDLLQSPIKGIMLCYILVNGRFAVSRVLRPKEVGLGIVGSGIILKR